MTETHYNCPKCGSTLVAKEGQYGKFMACPRFPECRYTTAAWALTTNTPELEPICDLCNGTGFLPFKKDGKVITHVRLDCECKLSVPEHFEPVRIRVEDFDFACSYFQRAYQAEEYEGISLPPLEEKRFPIEHTPPAPVQDFYILGRLAYLQHQVESLKKTSHSHSYKKSTISLYSTLLDTSDGCDLNTEVPRE